MNFQPLIPGGGGPVWSIAIGITLIVVLIVIGVRKLTWYTPKPDASRCPECHYDRRALSHAEPCPECGSKPS